MTCPTCHQDVDLNNRFCPGCGRPTVGPRVSKVAAILTDDFDVDELSRLQRERQRLTEELQAILDAANDGEDVSEEDQERYRTLRRAWGSLTDAISIRMDYLESRKAYERRNVNRRHRDRRIEDLPIDFPDRRASDRRGAYRRSGADRRLPFD
jgi:hypothetical protein